MWSEPGDNQTTILSQAWTQNSYGEWVYTKARRFVVIKANERACCAVPITSYNGQGVAKKGVTKSDHAIIHTGRTTPSPAEAERPGRGEPSMQPYAIRVDPDVSCARLDVMSRINFAETHTIQHYAKVKPFGKVNRDSVVHLLTQYRLLNFNSGPTASLQPAGSQSSLQSLSRLHVQFPSSSLSSPVALSQTVTQRAIHDLMTMGWSLEDAVGVVRLPCNGPRLPNEEDEGEARGYDDYDD